MFTYSDCMRWKHTVDYSLDVHRNTSIIWLTLMNTLILWKWPRSWMGFMYLANCVLSTLWLKQQSCEPKMYLAISILLKVCWVDFYYSQFGFEVKVTEIAYTEHDVYVNFVTCVLNSIVNILFFYVHFNKYVDVSVNMQHCFYFELYR